MDLFAQAVGRATGNMEKAPQVALQMIAAMQESGLSAEDTSAKMLEVANAAGLSESQIATLTAALGGLQGSSSSAAGDLTSLSQAEGQASSAAQTLQQAATQTSGALHQVAGAAQTGQGSLDALGGAAVAAGSVGTENMGALSQSYLEQIPNIEHTYDATEKLRESIENIPREIEIQTTFLGWEGNAPPGMARGGTIGAHGLALVIVGERGPEGAIFPGGTRGIVGLHGPELNVFPAGTQIIPNTQISAFLQSIPRMASGGTVQAMPIARLHLTVNVTGNTIASPMDAKKVAAVTSQEIRRQLEPYLRRR
jgi:hypothetical protein